MFLSTLTLRSTLVPGTCCRWIKDSYCCKTFRSFSVLPIHFLLTLPPHRLLSLQPPASKCPAQPSPAAARCLSRRWTCRPISTTSSVWLLSAPARSFRSGPPALWRVRPERVQTQTPGGCRVAISNVKLSRGRKCSYCSSCSFQRCAGIPTAATSVTLGSGANSLLVTFTAPVLLTNVDTFAYKLYALGDTSTVVSTEEVVR